ncbi:hypothetical protein GmHk_09G027092 [Glycine max]|nr:hypothetical protein GmHk_09G027092 [Glycine max]
MRYLQFLRDLRECNTYARGATLLGFLYREMRFHFLDSIMGMERCPTLAPSFIPPQQQNTPLAYRWLGGEIHHIANDNLLDFHLPLGPLVWRCGNEFEPSLFYWIWIVDMYPTTYLFSKSGITPTG